MVAQPFISVASFPRTPLSAEGRHTGQGAAMELGWKVQQLKRALKSELRGKELGTQPRGSNSWLQVEAVRKPREQVLVYGLSQKASGVTFTNTSG